MLHVAGFLFLVKNSKYVGVKMLRSISLLTYLCSCTAHPPEKLLYDKVAGIRMMDNNRTGRLLRLELEFLGQFDSDALGL